MTAALNPTGIWDSSVCKAAEERLCGQREQARVSLCTYASGSYIPSNGGGKKDTNPTDVRQTQSCSERWLSKLSGATQCRGESHRDEWWRQESCHDRSANVSCTGTRPDINNEQFQSRFSHTLMQEDLKKKKKARSSNLHSRMTTFSKKNVCNLF